MGSEMCIRDRLKSKAIDIPSLAAIHYGFHFVPILNNSKFMVSLAFEKTGWLNRYLSYRTATPFELTEQYRKLAEGKSDEEILDNCLYAEVKKKWDTAWLSSNYRILDRNGRGT